MYISVFLFYHFPVLFGYHTYNSSKSVTMDTKSFYQAGITFIADLMVNQIILLTLKINLLGQEIRH